MGMQLPVNQSLLKLPADRGRTFTFCRCITLAWKPEYSLTKSVTLFKRLYYNPTTRDQHSWLKMARFHMVILADKFPKIDPKPYWIRHFNAWKVQGVWEYISVELLF